MYKATISRGVQYGGRSTEEFHRHTWGLKLAAEGLYLEEFPVKELAFLLRVDGEFVQWEFSGPAHVAVGRNDNYISLDLGFTLEDQKRLVEYGDQTIMTDAVLGSVELLKKSRRKVVRAINFNDLEETLNVLVERYPDIMTGIDKGKIKIPPFGNED